MVIHNPIHFDDIVGLSHPGTRARIALNKGTDFLHFRITGGNGIIQNGSVVTIVQDPQQYGLIAPDQKWKLSIYAVESGNRGCEWEPRVSGKRRNIC
jgi:hypothetical protein